MLIGQILDFIHNYFIQSTEEGTFSVVDGVLQTTNLQPRQFFWINGSTFCNGAHQYDVEPIKYDGFNVTETFTGTVSTLAIPSELLELTNEIQTYINKHGDAMNSPYQSESFGGYSYTKARGGWSSADSADWRNIFKTRLNRWRKL